MDECFWPHGRYAQDVLTRPAAQGSRARQGHAGKTKPDTFLLLTRSERHKGFSSAAHDELSPFYDLYCMA